MALTPLQNKAVNHRGSDILVSAAAGAGKTYVLVERVLSLVLDSKSPIDLDEILVVTYTEKAAAEMKERIRGALTERRKEDPQNEMLTRQTQLLDKAQISTIHAFCLKILKRYYYRLRLDPSFRVVDAKESDLLKLDAVDMVFEDLYAQRKEEFLGLIRRYGGYEMDRALKELVLSIHNFAFIKEDPKKWLEISMNPWNFEGDFMNNPSLKILFEEAKKDIERALQATEKALCICSSSNGPQHYESALESDKHFFLSVLSHLKKGKADDMSGEIANFKFQGLKRAKAKNAEEELKRERVKRLRAYSKNYFDKLKEYAIFRDVEEVLAEESETSLYLDCLKDVILLFENKYQGLKADRNGLDFQDLERLCLKVLTEDDGVIGRQISREFRHIFIDEYQDTNPLQELIIDAIKKKDTGNLFMVGDIKQSIYRFRLAEPNIFLNKLRVFKDVDEKGESSGVKVNLRKNFRSRQGVIDAVNYVFENIMKEDLADIEYKDGHELVKGALYPQDGDEEYKAELHLIEREDFDEAYPSEDLSSIEKEASLAAKKIKEWVASGKFRFKDIAVLMRATKGRANAVARVFERWGIPVFADTGSGYFKAREVEVALALLSLVDNPRQDIPLASVLRSPIGNFSPTDLADIRACTKDGDFFHAFSHYAKDNEDASLFLKRLDGWRTMARRRPLGEVVWRILEDTGYVDYVGGLPGGDGRQANLLALIQRAHEFDSFGHHGLYRFLRFIERLQESEGDLGTARALGEDEDVVRIMSIHKSKGLEFPLVFVMDLGKGFNMQDIRKDILYHSTLGMGAVYCDVKKSIKYPSLIHQSLSKKILRENLAEEMRILYVAMTRAREKLFLIGSVRGLHKSLEDWAYSPKDLGACLNPLEWIGPLTADDSPLKVECWGIFGKNPIPQPELRQEDFTEALWNDVKRLSVPKGYEDFYSPILKRLDWRYPFKDSCSILAKMTVTEAKRRLMPDEEVAGYESFSLRVKEGARSGLERGIAVHAFLSNMALDISLSVEDEVERLSFLGLLNKDNIENPDIRMIKDFLLSPTGRLLLEKDYEVRREVPFTMALPAQMAIPEGGPHRVGSEDFIVLQGIIDALLIRDGKALVFDYKTDRVTGDAFTEAVKGYTPQVSLYGHAVKSILGFEDVKCFLVFLWAKKVVEVEWGRYVDSLVSGADLT